MAKGDLTKRLKYIQPSIDIIQLLDSNGFNAVFQKWYSTQRSDIKWAIIVIQHALEKYPPEDREWLLDFKRMGSKIDNKWI